MAQQLSGMEEAVDAILARAGKRLVVGAPLGIGKPNALLNSLWRRAREDRGLELEIFTALSLSLPEPSGVLQRRFLEPFLRRHFGADYPQLEYLRDLRAGTLPANAMLAEFYMQSGSWLKNAIAQRHYTASNYTHAARDMADRGVNVIVQLVAVEESGGETFYSFGSNPDTTQDLLDVLARRGQPRPLLVAVVNRDMPFMTGRARRPAVFFDLIVDDPDCQHQLFAPPITPVNLTDHAIGLLASTLIADGGTLQIGIGSLSDAMVAALKLRHESPEAYRQLLREAGIQQRHQWLEAESLGEFEQGLYAASEMFMDGFMHLYKAGILKRRVWPDAGIQRLLNRGVIQPRIDPELLERLFETATLPPILDAAQLRRLQSLGIVREDVIQHGESWLCADGSLLETDLRVPENRRRLAELALNTGMEMEGGAVLHAAFFLGSRGFYDWLRGLDAAERELFQMTPVSQINELYGGEELDRAQRIRARFVNTTMKVTLLGAAASDGLEDNQVVSGVGGQYNFVAMAHALPDSRSILMLRSTHGSGGKLVSNIVWTFPYDTIPRHLRDVVITEYGIAMLRGKSDEECVKAMLCIADSRFQEGLRKQAVAAGKLDPGWSLPALYRHNTPVELRERLAAARSRGSFPEWPFGSDFDATELQLIKALRWLKSRSGSSWAKLKTLAAAWSGNTDPEKYRDALQRMDMLTVKTFTDRFYRRLLLLALDRTRV